MPAMFRFPLILLTLTFAASCSPSAGSGTGPLATDPPLQRAATIIDSRPAAIVNGRTVLWGDLRPLLTEAAGATALQELALDRELEEAMRLAQVRIFPDAIEAERERLLESLSIDPDRAVRLLEELRSRQGLGDTRFDHMLRRNAALRALTARRVEVSDESVRRMYDLVHGPKRQCRIMVFPKLGLAEQSIKRLTDGEFFGDIAVAMSTDSSAARGGLLEPFSETNPTYPKALREALFNLELTNISDPIMLEGGYAVIMYVRLVRAGETPFEIAETEMRRLVRLNQERILMDQLARRMLDQSHFIIFDESLSDSWRRRPRP